MKSITFRFILAGLLMAAAIAPAQIATTANAARDRYLQRIAAAEKIKNDGVAKLTQDYNNNTQYAKEELKRSFEAMIRTAAMRNQTEEVRTLTLQMESLLNPDGVVLNGSTSFQAQGTDYKDLVGTWVTAPNSGYNYNFEFKSNKSVMYTYEYKTTSGGGGKYTYEYRATAKSDKIILSRPGEKTSWFEISLPFDTAKLAITRRYETATANNTTNYTLVKQP